jgi:ElaB/YqjD/DUF883 family membrane-anchored ribosome-binding protein
MSASTTDPGNRSSAEIEREVERTRAQVEGTLEELRERASPGQLFEEVMDYARRSGGPEFMRNLGEAVRDNPLPVLLIGAGIGWLMMSGNRPRHHAAARSLPPLPAGPGGARSAPTHVGTSFADTGRAPIAGPAHQPSPGPSLGERASAAAGEVGGRAGAAVDSARAGVADAAHRAGEAASAAYHQAADAAGTAARQVSATVSEAVEHASDYADAAREQVRHLGQEAQQGVAWLVREQPLVLGALGLAVGAAVGALLPSTETEDRLMGETRDALADRARDVAQEGYEKAKHLAETQLERAQAAAGEAAGQAREAMDRGGLGAAAGNLAREAREAVRETARELGAEARDALGDAGRDEKAAAGEQRRDDARREAAPGPSGGLTSGPAGPAPGAGTAPIVGPGSGPGQPGRR